MNLSIRSTCYFEAVTNNIRSSLSFCHTNIILNKEGFLLKKEFQHQRPSYAFLMEMLWVCGFFVICSGIFASLFVKANHISTESENLNYAITLAQSKLESAFSKGYNAKDETIYYTSNWEPTTKNSPICYAVVTTTCNTQNDLLTVSVVIKQKGSKETIYELTGSHYLATDLKGGDLS